MDSQEIDLILADFCKVQESDEKKQKQLFIRLRESEEITLLIEMVLKHSPKVKAEIEATPEMIMNMIERYKDQAVDKNNNEIVEKIKSVF